MTRCQPDCKKNIHEFFALLDVHFDRPQPRLSHPQADCRQRTGGASIKLLATGCQGCDNPGALKNSKGEPPMVSLRMALPLLSVLALVFAVLMAWPGISAFPQNTDRARAFLDAYTKKIRPLEIAANQAWWNANITGKDEHFKAKEDAQNEIDAVLSSPKDFAEVKAIKEAGNIDDKILARAIDLVYLAYLEKQVDPQLLKKMTALANSVEKKFSTFRATVDGKEMDDKEVRKVLKTSKVSERRQEVYEASKAVGKVVEAELLQLVQLRNQAARKLNFKNYHDLQLYLNEQDGKELVALFDKLDEMTRQPFKAAKAEIDAKLANDCNIKPQELMPWHYHDPFFQEAPNVFATNLDGIYANLDLLRLCSEFYRSIDLPIDRVIERTGDFAPKKGKNPHAFCIDLTRDGSDVRVLANVVADEYWMSTLLHEFGHSVYTSINIPEKLPYVLRLESHILTTEGVAMMFERLSKRRTWLEKMGVKVDDAKGFDETASKIQRYRLLIFARWCQVMLRFEKSMYEDPDQDLNKLWWDMVERYQLLKRPQGRNAPDYGSKIHIVSAPVYYHNYMLGEMFASQLHHAIAKEVFGGADPESVVYVGNKEVGRFMRERVFAPGRTVTWNALTHGATGADLSPAAFAKDFQGK
jgi:peptidyl-dipeptidase A